MLNVNNLIGHLLQVKVIILLLFPFIGLLAPPLLNLHVVVIMLIDNWLYLCHSKYSIWLLYQSGHPDMLLPYSNLGLSWKAANSPILLVCGLRVISGFRKYL